MREQLRCCRWFFRLQLMVGLLGSCLGIAGPIFAGAGGTDVRDQLYEFHIPAGPLETSIAIFTRQTHTSVLYDADLLKNRAGQSVEGLFSYPIALETLLAETGIGVRYADDNNFVLAETGNFAAEGGETSVLREASITLGLLHIDAPSDFSLYGAILAADLQRSLSKRANLRSMNFFVQANLWVDSAGRVLHAELARSTGDRGRDQNLMQALGEFSVSRPPPQELPQPVLVSIDIHRL